MKTKLNAMLLKKPKWKRVSALVMVLFLLINNIIYPNIVQAASSADRYPHSYTIEDLLTYFQYVTKEDCTLVTHTVGPVAVGGTLAAGGVVVGDGARTPSYANNLSGVSLPSGSQDAYGGSCNDFYYSTTTLQENSLSGFTQNSDYMDIAGKFSSVQTQSSALLTNAAAPTIVDQQNGEQILQGYGIVCDFTKNSTYTVSFEQIKAAKYLDMIVSSVEDFKTNKYVINITGMDVTAAQTFCFDSTNSMGNANSTSIDIRCNGLSTPYMKSLSGKL